MASEGWLGCMADEYQEVPVDKLKLGYVLNYPVLERDEVLLLSVGTVITPRVVELLHQRGIDYVRINAAEAAAAAIGNAEKDDEYAKPIEAPDRFYKKLVAPLANAGSNRASTLFKSATSLRMDAEIRARGNLARSPGHGVMQIWSRKLTNLDDFHEAIRERDAREDELANRCKEIQYDIVHRARVDPNPVYKWMESELVQLSRDPDLFVFLNRPPASSPYPGIHSYQVARLSMAVAAHLRWSHEEIIAIGAGALVHDTGMLRLSDRIYRTRNRIDSLQRQDLIKHPVYALDLVGLENDLHEYIRYIAYQTHERCNGSGYPRAWPIASIHPAARLVGLVDAYVAMVSQRPHRNPLLPHQAILEIMQEAHAGLWEPALTRGLLRTVSLYPLGSFLELSDGRLARGVQANANDHRRPLLETWVDPAAIAREPGELLDLAAETRVTVSRAVPPPQIL